MSVQAQSGEQKRTAVLVVHGMGSQRPLDTVRGVVNAVWRDNPDNKVWFHPEPSGTDIDLTVQTTSCLPLPDGTIPKEGGRRIDFHELYWAHLIAETRAIAVLLWLFELARRGPYLKHGMRPIWWIGAPYLSFLILSVSYLASEIVERLARVETERLSMIGTPLLTIFIVAVLSVIWSLAYRSFRISRWAVLFVAVSGLALWLIHYLLSNYRDLIEGFATHFLPATFSFGVAWLLMGRWAFGPFAVAYFISWLFHVLKLLIIDKSIQTAPLVKFVPWSLDSSWSSIAAWLFIASYFVLSIAFLQPVIGDVARYLRSSPANVAGRRDIRRNAVDTLLALHKSEKYDRIIVVAHSLGAMVAYDMLRATFARLFRDIPIDQSKLNPEFDAINAGELKGKEWRRTARALMRKLYDRTSQAANAADGGPYPWKVTDFVTLGNPLTHAQYLLCHGKSVTGPIKDVRELIKDFERRVKEREFPTCQPKMSDGDMVLTYTSKHDGQPHLHQAALFGLTRWTNIYFPLSQVFWGDAIGGPVGMYETGKKNPDGTPEKKELFGRDVVDVEVSVRTDSKATFFTHTAYWSVERDEKRKYAPGAPDSDPPHVRALKLAMDLADSGNANDSENYLKIDGVKLAG